MRPNPLLRSVLPGFAPILVYIAVEAIWGETAGLAAGLALGLGEFAFILIRERRVDPFTLADTILLAGMGLLSWALTDPRFFRLKPAVSGGVLSVVLLALALGPRRLILPYFEKRLGMGAIPPAAERRMLAMVAGFAALTLLHSALTAAAALWWSKAAWNFIAGALFWILALLYALAWTLPALAARRRAARGSGPLAVFGRAPDGAAADGPTGLGSAASAGAPGGAAAPGRPGGLGGAAGAGIAAGGAAQEGRGEFLPVVNEEGSILGKAPRPLCHAGPRAPKLLHPVVRLWLADPSGGFWLQKRAARKLVQPGKWDCAVGGHLAFGETVEAALLREAAEEIGLAGPSSGPGLASGGASGGQGAGALQALRPLARFVWETELERELVFVFIASLAPGAAPAADRDEVDELRVWSRQELAAELAKAPYARSLTALAAFEAERIEELLRKP